MRQTALILAVVAAVFLSVTPAFPQHTLAAKFDTTKPQTLKGTVTQIDWSNPYVHILMKVPGTPRPTLWAVELDSAILLSKNGWSADSLPLGETITVQGFLGRDNNDSRKQISGNSVTTSSGKK